jgi:hypothetical protein
MTVELAQHTRGEREPLGPEEVAELQEVLWASDLPDVALSSRYSVVFVYPGMGLGDVYPDLAGCTLEVCTFIGEAARFAEHGIQVLGLSTEPSEPPPPCSAIPFPVGLLPEGVPGGLIDVIEREQRRYAARATYVVFPDGTGVRIGNVTDIVAHVTECLDIALGRRLEAYREAVLASLQRNGNAPRSSVRLRDLLANGADSVSIPRVDLSFELVAKLADPRIVAEEAGYMDRINGVLEERGLGPLFPRVVGIRTDEVPGWYLMEAANPVTLDQVLFADEARTVLRPDRVGLLERALEKVSNLHEATFRPEVPKIARYHYLERFLVIPERDDTRATFELLFGSEVSLEERLTQPLVLEDGFVCRSYREQMAFLEAHVDELSQPVGAYLHGDFHLPNILLDPGGENVVFVDPRIVWDGHDVGDPGFNDPMYDLAALLQSVHVAAPVLEAIREGTADALLGDHGVLRLHGNPILDWYVGWVERLVPVGLRGDNWRARLHIGTANAVLGWLKYARSVKTRHAWDALFAAVLYHLELGRRHLEGRNET